MWLLLVLPRILTNVQEPITNLHTVFTLFWMGLKAK
jgi:hypothetical protein